MSDATRQRLLAATMRARKEKKILQEFEHAHHYEEESDDQEAGSDDPFDDVAFYIVGISFCVLLVIIAFAFILQGDDTGHRQQHGRRRNRQNGRRTKSTVVDVPLSLNELYTGVEKVATVSRQVVCPRDQSECQSSLCRGQRVQVHRTRDMWSGRIDETFYCRFSVKVKGNIVAGTKAGDTIRIAGQGNISPGLLQGDVVFRIHQLSHRDYRRDDVTVSTLHRTINISLKESLLGFSRSLIHLDGSTYVVTSKSGTTTSPGEVVTKTGLGMPVQRGGKKRGNMLITVNIKYPKLKILDDAMIEQIERLF